MTGKLTSRKFWVAMIGQVTAIAVLLFPQYESEIAAAANNLGALLLMALSGMGYIQGEASIDAERQTAKAARNAKEDMESNKGF